MPFDPNVQSALNLFSAEFEVETVNESGSNGFVLIGKHKLLERPAVIKICGCDPDDINESSLLASCVHQNVVQIFHACRDATMGNMCFFLEQCDSDLVDVTVYGGHRFSYLLGLLQGVLSGLSYLHTKAHPIIHGDIKQENVLVKDGVAKICDFGSAFEFDHTIDHIPRGSILFRPPESVVDNPSYGVKSDLYQVGVLGYYLFGGTFYQDLSLYLTKQQRSEMLKLQKGFEQSMYIDGAIKQKIRTGNLLRWRSLPEYVPNRIVRILKKATEVNIDNRYGSASEMMVDCSNIVNSFLDWIIVGEFELCARFNGDEFRISREQKYWYASSAAHNGSWRRKHNTKDTSFSGCLHKFKSVIGADRDS